jgi:hypothetical protein
MAPAELSPTAVPGKQVATLSAQATTPTPAHAAWQCFVDQVERGEIKDPSGQYVAKGTPGAVDAGGRRMKRPKFDAATPAFARRFTLVANGSKAMAVKPGAPAPSLTQPIDPPCDGCGPGGPSAPAIYSTFTTSENRGGNGYIHDLKISTVGVEQYTKYIKLGADLNKGAGGAYIDLAFTRNTKDVISGREYYSGDANSTPSDILTSFTTKIADGWWDNPSRNTNYFYMWAPTRATYTGLLNSYTAWDYQDLNAGAGGEYIYSFQSKSSHISAYGGQISEIGILSGNSSTIKPPAGWNKYPRDLNEGAGGEYIYFCYKY